MPHRERQNYPVLLVLTFVTCEAITESGTLRGRYGGRGMEKVFWRIGKGGSRSRFDSTVCNSQ